LTFGVIVLNGEPFTRHVLRALYPFAHQIVIAEGAAPAARVVAGPDGHSSDGTLEVLRRFKVEEDPENKVEIVTAEDEGHPNGFWPGEKDEQSQAYARRATGDYLWQVDIDEFYRPDDIAQIRQMLIDDPTITGMTFKQLAFWGGLDYVTDGWYLRRGGAYFHRLFKWRPGYIYKTHRPPTVLDDRGRDLREGNWLDGEMLAASGIRLYHYSLLLPKTVMEKSDYYSNAAWAPHSRDAVAWAQEAYLGLKRPFRVHNVYSYPSWLERYSGAHPPEVLRLVAELGASGASAALRPTYDIERLLRSRWYTIGRYILRRLDSVEAAGRSLWWRAARRIRR
jgi:hypothetical protein